MATATTGASGNTIHSIAAARRMVTAEPQTSMAETRAVTRSPTGSPAPGSRYSGKAAMSPAAPEVERAWAIARAGLEETGHPPAVVARRQAIVAAVAGSESAAATFRRVRGNAEVAALEEEVQEASTARARAQAAAGDPRAWAVRVEGLAVAVVAAVVAAAVAAGGNAQ